MKLSICIPTYNFGKFIGETLESIIPQLTPDVEIVILDGASTDNTAEVVKDYQKRTPQIRYFRQSEKGGIDKDMHLSMEKARGEYCWLFSADDKMHKGSLAYILREIAEGHDVYVCGFSICSLDMTKEIEEHRFTTIQQPMHYNLSDARERRIYFESAIATPAFFSFMSSLTIKRKRWLETDLDPSFFGSCWAHAARIFKMIPKGLNVKCLPTSLMDKRAFNDSFMDKGYIYRISIAVDGYHNLATCIFGSDSFEAFHIRKTLRNEFPLKGFMVARKSVTSSQEARELLRLILKTYQDFFVKKWLIAGVVFSLPKKMISFLRFVYRKLLRKNLHECCLQTE